MEQQRSDLFTIISSSNFSFGASFGESIFVKARPHYKSPCQLGEATWPSSLVEQLKSSGVNDKPSSFIVSNEADRLRHPVRLNGGKCQRKANRLRHFRFVSAAIFVIHYPSPTPITGPLNWQYCVFVKHF